ncbi:MAG: esterase-like activity of phytase family protein, partial [Hyphomicrobiales bacterium]
MLSARIRAIAAAGTFAAALALGAPGSGSEELTRPVPVEATVRAIPFETGFPGRTRFGKLEWLGTLELESESPYFGGYSGIAVSADGKEFMAVSDAGSWLRGRIVTNAAGLLTGVAGLTAGPLLGPDGKPLDRKADADAEGVASAVPGRLDGETFIAFERRHRIVVSGNGPEGLGPVTRQVVLPPEALKASSNAGL